MTSSSNSPVGCSTDFNDWVMIEHTAGFDPKNAKIKPTPSPMAILNLDGPEDARGLKLWEKDSRREVRSAAMKAGAISHRVLVDDAVAKVCYNATHHLSRGDYVSNVHQVGYQISDTPCGPFERLYFYHLSPEEQMKMRDDCLQKLNSLAKHLQLNPKALPFSVTDPRFDTLLFSNKSNFESALLHTLGKDAKERFTALQTSSTQLETTPREMQRHLDKELGQKSSDEKKMLRIKTAIGIAMEKDTGVLGGRWTGLQKHIRVYGADHAAPKSCTLKEREHFFGLPPLHQDAIRTQLYKDKGLHSQRVLAELGIGTEEQLALQTGGAYTSFASLVSDDMLFRDALAYQRAAHSI